MILRFFARVSLISFILISSLSLGAAEFKNFGGQQSNDSIRHRQKELSDSDKTCKMSLAFFTDPHGQISEFLFLGGTIILPCSCSSTVCDRLEFGYKKTSGPTGIDNLVALPPYLYKEYKFERDMLKLLHMADSIMNIAVIEVTQDFLVVANKLLKTGIYCTCDGSEEKAARVQLPDYRVCSDKECQKNCQKMPHGEPEICSVSFFDIAYCEIRSPNKTDNPNCLGTHQCHKNHSCPSLDQYLSYKDNHGMCLDSNGTYWRHGMCQAYHKSLQDDLTWEVDFHSEMPAIMFLMPILGVHPYAHLSDSCEKDLGSPIRLGGRDVRVLQTYQLTDASTSLLLLNGSACSRHTNPLHAFLCQDVQCSKRSPLPGNCDSGWRILLEDFTQFRHQIHVTNKKAIDGLALTLIDGLSKAESAKIKKMAKDVIPQDSHVARFYVIPDRILMINRYETTSDGNVTTAKKICLFPDGNKEAENNNCATEKEIHWMSCYPKIQKFIINQKPAVTSLISSTSASDGDAPMKWFHYVLIGVGSILAASLIIVGIVIFLQMRRRKRPAERLALFKMPEKAKMDDIQGSPIVLKELKDSVAVSAATVSGMSNVADDTTQKSSESDESKTQRIMCKRLTEESRDQPLYRE